MPVLAGEGVTVEVSTDGGTVYNELINVVSVSGPTSARAEVETTSIGSSAKTYRASEIKEAGTLDIQLWFDPDDTHHSTVETAGSNVYDYRLTLTDDTPTTYEFEAVVTGFELGGMEEEGNVTADVTLRITGDVTKT